MLDDVDEFLGTRVAILVIHQRIAAEILRLGIAGRGDDVPARAPT
jgi:hypothetical protein